eukprot:768820-Hanusia_phi.AAC.11
MVTRFPPRWIPSLSSTLPMLLIRLSRASSRSLASPSTFIPSTTLVRSCLLALAPSSRHISADLLGLGRETKEERGAVLQLGVKISLFDVTVPSSPKERQAIVLGGAGSYSEAAWDHKAFLLHR